ncbi:8846_t:CDS:2, partial [Racocetra fulgida]
GLKDVHTVTTFSTLKAAFTNNLGSAKLYLMNQNYLDNDDVFPKLPFEEFLPNSALSRYYGVNVVHSNGDALPIHLFVETGLKLMNNLEQIDNKPIEVNLGDPTNDYVTAYDDVQEELKNVIFTLLPLDRIPYFRNKRLRKIERLEYLFDEMIEKKHKSIAAGRSNGDLLELMINACNDQDNPSLTDIELRNVQQKAREEILRILGDDLTPSAEQHKSLKYLNMIIHENLRLHPPAPMLPFRKVTEDLKYKNYVIPADTGIAVFVYGIHHSPKLWENPEEFIPERFENEHHT